VRFEIGAGGSLLSQPKNEEAGILVPGLVNHKLVAGVRFELTTFGL
jgi:hypothetical protein